MKRPTLLSIRHLRNRAHPQRAPLNPTQDLMDVDTGTDSSGAVRDTSADHTPGHGLELARSETDDTEALEHSEPVWKQRRTGSPAPTGPAIGLSPEALPTESKNLYADLIMRQLHLVEQFWRAELS